MPPPLPSLANRIRRIVQWGLVAFVVLGIGGCLVENYRGHYLWKKYRKESEANGEHLDLTAFIPKPVPPEENFAATPFFAPFLDYTVDATDREQPRHWKEEKNYEKNKALATFPDPRGSKRKLPDTGHWQLGTFTDLNPWQEYFHGNTNFPFPAVAKNPANDVLAALRKYDDVLDELRVASSRPYSIFPVHYEEDFDALLPHLASLKSLAEIVRLRALAHLEAEQPADALDDVQLGLRLADSVKAEGFLISHLVRMAIADLFFQPIWEGLARQRWSEGQVTGLQSILARMNIIEDYGRAMRVERAVAIHSLDQLRTGKFQYHDRKNESEEGSATDYSKIRFLPGGIFRQNQLNIARRYQELIPLIDVEKHWVEVQGVNRAGEVVEKNRYHPYQLFANLLVPGVSRSAERFARAQAGFDLALVACALERHRFATGRYPETLEALVPRLIAKVPPDITSGDPLIYRLTDSNRFLLYSVGWNQTDDGGNPGMLQRTKKFDPKKSDWVWSYPPSADRAGR